MFEWLLSLDRALFTQINSVWTNSWFDSFFPFITDLHKTLYFKIILIPVVLSLFIWRRGFKKGFIIFIFTLLTLGLSDSIGNHFLKKTVERPRPADNILLHAVVRSPASGFSFVSNHATNNFSFATFVSSFFPPARYLVFAIAILVSYSRVYNGVHYPTDVIAGALLGILCGYVMSLLCRKVLQLVDERKKSL